MENKRAHLEMIQRIINRLSHNSFLLKGWSVILISSLFALAANDSQIIFVYLAYFPCVVFWGLDGYFLREEKLFRALYDYTRKINENDVDFSMDKSKVENEVDSLIDVICSKTLKAFHGVILISIIFVTIASILIQQKGS